MSKQNNQNFYDWRFFPFATGVNDTGGAPWVANISANFRKKLKQPGILRGLGETDSWKSKISWHCPFRAKSALTDTLLRSLVQNSERGKRRGGGIAKHLDVQYLPDNRTGIAVKGSFLYHSSPEKSERNVRFSQLSHFKGTVSRDFLLLVFLMNQFPPRPRVVH